MRTLTLLLLAACSAAGAQIGASPKVASPELYNQMKKQDALPTVGQVDARFAALAKSDAALKARMDTLIGQLAAMSTEVTAMRTILGDKDMSRVAVLERTVKAHEEAGEKLFLEAAADHAERMSWYRLLFGTGLASVFGVGAQIWIAKRRGKRQEKAVGSVREQVSVIGNTVDTVQQQTNGMTAKLETLAKDRGYSAGFAAAQHKQRVRPLNEGESE